MDDTAKAKVYQENGKKGFQILEFQFQVHQSCWPISFTHGPICWELNC
ncbi:hypothetical protein ACB092_05G182200 [Castanea dentata]